MKAEFTFEQLETCKYILFWGAGYHSQEVLRFYQPFFEKRQLQIVDKNKAGSIIEGYEVLSAGDIDYTTVDLTAIMTAIHHAEVEDSLVRQYGYRGPVIGLYAFRRLLLRLDSYNECKCHLNDFIRHMESGCASYSYDYIFQEQYSQYKEIRLFAFWSSSIGESIRYLTAYYDAVFMHRKDDEYDLLVPYIKGNDFANGRFIEIVSRTVPMVTYQNCHFWKYLLEKYPERFHLESYNDYNGILVDAYNQFDERIPQGFFCDRKFPVISYMEDEKFAIREKLEEMGIDREYVCIFARDNAYLQHQYGQAYAFNDIRDMDISSFQSAVEYLQTENIKTVRIGKHVKYRIDFAGCIDYASKYHSDLMDIYLCGNCKFYAGSLSGIVEFAQLQGVPALILGLVQSGIYNSIPYRSSDIYVPKKIYDKRNGRFLTFLEMWNAEMDAKDKLSQYYKDHQLEFIELAESEIRAAVIEMNERIDGTYLEDAYEKDLQRKYHELLEHWIEKNGYRYFYFQHINISGSFIKKNAFLLET